MDSEALITTLKSIKLFGMAQAVADLASQGSPAYQDAEAMLKSLPKAELAEREVRSVAYQMKIARYPVYRDLAGLDFSQSTINEAQFRQLHRCEFLEQAHNVALVGGPGTGKTQRPWRARPKNHYSPPRSASRRSSITATGCGSSRPSTSSMPWNSRRRTANRARWHTAWCMPTS